MRVFNSWRDVTGTDLSYFYLNLLPQAQVMSTTSCQCVSYLKYCSGGGSSQVSSFPVEVQVSFGPRSASLVRWEWSHSSESSWKTRFIGTDTLHADLSPWLLHKKWLSTSCLIEVWTELCSLLLSPQCVFPLLAVCWSSHCFASDFHPCVFLLLWVC